MILRARRLLLAASLLLFSGCAETQAARSTQAARAEAAPQTASASPRLAPQTASALPRLAPLTASASPRLAPQAIATIDLQPYRTRLRTVTAKVGTETGRFLLDTAGGLSMLTPEFARKVGCEPWGRITGFRMMGDRVDTPQCSEVKFELPGVALRAPVAGVLDLMSFFPKDAEKIDGLIALDVLAGQALTLDFASNHIVVESPESLAARTRSMREGLVRIGREAQGAALNVLAAARTAKGLVWFELDSGNGGTILVGKHVAPLFGLDPAADKPQPARFELLGPATVEGNVFVPDMILDGNLGMPFLSRWVVTLDLARSRMWLAPSAGAAAAAPGGAGARSASLP